MGRSLFSNDLEKCDDELCFDLKEDLAELQVCLNRRTLKILKWDDNRIAVPVKVNVDLPPRGNYNDIDIRSEENILIIFHRSKHPSIPPRAFSDRKTFPRKGTAHLYVTAPDKPTPLCLDRNYNEWFANKRIGDLIVRVENWLRDAANGDLAQDGDQFDPMRLENYRGNVVYQYNLLKEIVVHNKAIEGKTNFTIGLFKESEKQKVGKDSLTWPTFELLKVFDKSDDLMKVYDDISESIVDHRKGLKVKRLLFGFVVWDSEQKINSTFPDQLPGNLAELADFCEVMGVKIFDPVGLLIKIKLPDVDQVPFIVGVNRPKPLIGYSGNIEFFNFYFDIKKGDIIEKELAKNISVGFQKHSESLSIKKAKEVSGSHINLSNSMIFGCGALGSKIVTHLIREGNIGGNMVLFDPDKVEPHNLVRYGLLDESIGENKATALKNAAERLYPSDKSRINITPFPASGDLYFDLPGHEVFVEKSDWIMDFTASTSFENFLLRREFYPNNKVVKGSITDKGNLGLLFIEGADRNPRIDDLQVLCQAEYLSDPRISSWLQREYEFSKLPSVLVNVGVGCNSETTILSDDKISIHAASMVQTMKTEGGKKNVANGVCQLTMLKNDDGFEIQTKRLEIKPLTVFKSNEASWEIRMKDGLQEILMAEMGKAMPRETGGVFIGIVNNKTKCIHITDVITAPPDSSSNEVCFIRGVEGLKDQVNYHKLNSGQTFGYVGEWHSHPHGPMEPSGKDIRTMSEYKKAYDSEGLGMPVFVMIVTPMGLVPCIY